jgi:hypothetical protein
VATKQDALEHYAETSGTTTDLVNTVDDAPLITASPDAVVSHSGFQTITFPNGIYMNRAQGHVVGTRLYLTVEARTSASSELAELPFAIANADGTWGDTIVFRLTPDFVKYTWSTVISNQHVLIFLHKAQTGDPTSVYAPLAGSVDLRNVHLYKTDALAAISTPLICARDLDCQQTVLCKHLIADHGLSAERVHLGGGGSLSRGNNGELLWDGNQVSALAHYSETSSATTTIVQSFDTATPVSIHVSWAGTGTRTNVAGSHQELTFPGSHYLNYGGQTPGEMVYMSLELKAGTSTSMAFASRDDTHWTDSVVFQGLSSNDWTTFTWSFQIPSTGRAFVVAGFLANAGDSVTVATAISGTVLLRNFHMYTSADLVTIDAPLRCEKDAFFSTSIESQHAYIATITAAQYFSSSDQRIKNDVQDVSLEACQRIFDAVSPKVYERTDMPGQRIGFIAQDVQSSAPPEFANLWGTRPSADGQELLTIDYSRLITIAWAQLKLQQARIDTLEARIQALEEAQ